MTGSRPLSVAVVTTSFPHRVETFVTSRARSLAERGHRVTAFSYYPPQEGWQGLMRDRGLTGVRVVHGGPRTVLAGLGWALTRPRLLALSLGWLTRACWRAPGQLARGLAALPFAFHVVARLNRDPHDVVHVEWGHYPAVVVPLVRWAGLPTVTSLSLIAYDIYRGFPGTRTAARMADVVRTQASGNLPQIAEVTGLPPDRVALVPDGVDTAHVAAVTAGVRRVPGRVVVVSRLVVEKGVYEALEAFRTAREERPGATLRFYGDGPEEEGLRHAAAERGLEGAVTFMGHVAHDEVLRGLAEAEVLLHLSHKERLPNAVKEAMACGCVVVTTRTVGIEELVEDGRTGYLVDVGDAAAAGELLRRALADPAGHEPMRRAGVAHVRTTMDHEASVEKLVGLWRAALARHGAAARTGAAEAAPFTGAAAAGPTTPGHRP